MHVDLFFRRLQRRGQKFAANHFSSIQIIVFYYILMTVLSLVLFYMPIFREPDSHVSFVDMLFMAISTVSVTGLSTFDINSVFNDNGIILLEILFQVGGLGIMMISTAFVI
ncbi:ATP synthase, partial [Enterococcus faecium MRSN 4777]